ncbi:uncharacterized protein MKZ38_004967 [Zalerion maritima]|uniref:Velvet domain-containing protein n=1 Tax=Zalerion maritima TaxID=339359 RepID=A0AAD5RKN1_9PEZI|nr:uncharacterized protein MKZ38_004967 [Zalerion maritima]
MIHSMPGMFGSDPLANGEFDLIVRQNPECAKVAVGKEKDRKPVDPPPILQLKCHGDQAQHFLQSPYFFCSCALAPESDTTTTPPSNSIVGTLVSSLHKLKDSDNSDGGFFVFGDLSVKQEGRFRLQFDLFELRDGRCIHHTAVQSDIFTVHSPKNFPGMAESTFLTRSFSDQGVRLRLRKDSRALTSRKRTSAAADLNHQMMPQKMESVGRYYEDTGLDRAKRRKFSQEQGPSPHHSLPNTPYGARSAAGPYTVDTVAAVSQGLMNSPVSYAPQGPVLPRPNQSPVSYTQSPQSYGVPVQVSGAPETTQPYSHPGLSVAETDHSRGYPLGSAETSQSYSLAAIQTSDPQQQPPPSYHSIHTGDSTPSYQSQTPISTQLPSLGYALPTPDTPQDGTMPRENSIGRISVSDSMGSMGNMVGWQQQTPHQPPTPNQGQPTTLSQMSNSVTASMAFAGPYSRHAAQS